MVPTRKIYISRASVSDGQSLRQRAKMARSRSAVRSVEGKRQMRNARKKRKRQQRAEKRAQERLEKNTEQVAKAMEPLKKDVGVQRQLVSKYYKLWRECARQNKMLDKAAKPSRTGQRNTEDA